jgi:hypothetical protein
MARKPGKSKQHWASVAEIDPASAVVANRIAPQVPPVAVDILQTRGNPAQRSRRN